MAAFISSTRNSNSYLQFEFSTVRIPTYLPCLNDINYLVLIVWFIQKYIFLKYCLFKSKSFDLDRTVRYTWLRKCKFFVFTKSKFFLEFESHAVRVLTHSRCQDDINNLILSNDSHKIILIFPILPFLNQNRSILIRQSNILECQNVDFFTVTIHPNLLISIVWSWS